MAGAEAGAEVAAESVEHPRHTVAGSNKLATQLQENARYTEQLEMFKYVLPPSASGLCPRAKSAPWASLRAISDGTQRYAQS